MKMWMKSRALPAGVLPPRLPGCFCRWIGLRGPVAWTHWAGYSQHLGDCDHLFSLLGSGCQNGSVVCNMIRCKFYMEEINAIKTLHISGKSDSWPGHYHCLAMSVMFGYPPRCVRLILMQNINHWRGERVHLLKLFAVPAQFMYSLPMKWADLLLK